MKTHLILVLLSSLVLTSSSFAADAEGGIIKMISVSPSTTFEGLKLLEGAVIGTLGVIKTGTDGGAKIKVLKSGVVLDLAYDAQLKIIRPAGGEAGDVIELVDGAVRVHVPELKSPTSGKPPFTIRTKTVSMGVRGTEFLGIVNPILDESELVVFKGKVEFVSAADPKDFRMVTPGYWSGIGGRFGKKTSELVKLPKIALDQYEKVGLDTPAFSVEKATSGTPSPTQKSENSH